MWLVQLRESEDERTAELLIVGVDVNGYVCRVLQDRHFYILKRHNLTTCVMDNVKPARAEVDADAINSFFDEWENAAGTVPPENLYNYDETNACDDPVGQ